MQLLYRQMKREIKIIREGERHADPIQTNRQIDRRSKSKSQLDSTADTSWRSFDNPLETN